MQLSHESYRTRWIILVSAWIIVSAGIFRHAWGIRLYLDNADQLGLRGAAISPTPLREVYPTFAADAQTWVRHSIALTEGHDLQLRHTTIDNAPDGREVHWNSAWAWTIAGAGWINHLFTGQPVPTAIERATVWLTPCALLFLTFVLSTWATKRAGVIIGVCLVCAMTCSDRIYEGFFPSYVDHHGLMTVAVLGMALGAVFMGAGWWRADAPGLAVLLPPTKEAALSGATFSAICGAAGMWVTAASIIPPIAIVGAAGVLAIIIQGRNALKNGEHFAPEVWRRWGRVGAVASFVFYLVEYFPGHLSFHMEANHPFFSLAWLGAGELIAQFGERWLGAPADRWKNPVSLVWPLATLAAAPLTILIGGTKVFIMLDPFLAHLHSDYIQEFLPIWRTIQGMWSNPRMVYEILLVENMPLFLGIGFLTYRGRETPIVVWFAIFATVFFNCMAWWQSRWLLNASGMQVCLALILLTTWTRTFSLRTRWIAAAIMFGVLYLPSGALRVALATVDAREHHVNPSDANNCLFRDIAAVIRTSQPTGDITLLTSPNSSTAIGYYGRFKTLGTLYWENDAGLHAAADIFAAETDDKAAELIKKHGVTHIAIISLESFIFEYFQLLHPELRGNPEAAQAAVKKTFGYRLLVDRAIPQWLEMLPYSVPDDLKALNITSSLYKVNFRQNVAEALYHAGLGLIAGGSMDQGEQMFDLLIQKAPQIYQPYLRKGELMMARHDWNGAVQMFAKGISLAPAEEHPGLYITHAGSLYNAGQQGAAAKLYRLALAEKPTPDIECYLGWILASSKDDSLRDGKEALRLAQAAMATDPRSPSYLNTLAAAWAENNRFPEAVQAADQALANSKIKGDPEAVQAIFARRLETLKSGKPLRE